MKLPAIFRRAEPEPEPMSSDAGAPPAVAEVPAIPPASTMQRAAMGSVLGLGAALAFHLSFYDLVQILRSGEIPELGEWGGLALCAVLLLLARDTWRRGLNDALTSPSLAMVVPLFTAAAFAATGDFGLALGTAFLAYLLFRGRDASRRSPVARWLGAGVILSLVVWVYAMGTPVFLLYAALVAWPIAAMLWPWRRGAAGSEALAAGAGERAAEDRDDTSAELPAR